MTATITRKIKKATKEKPQSLYKRLHVIIPIEDMLWASQQKPSVNQLWQECWTADPYGSRWMPLSTALGYSSFICAKKILSESGLFIFKPDKSIQDGRETVGWLVRNLHGSRMKDFWEQTDSANQQPDSTKQESNAENLEMDADILEIDAKNLACISGKTQSEQEFQKHSRTSQKHLTNSSKEIVRCDSSTQHKNTHCEEEAIAPLGGASPQIVESVEEEKELPTVTDCTSLALVDVVQGESALLEEGKPDFGVEPKVSHEDPISAAPVALGFKNSVTQTEEPTQQNQPASLEGEKPDCSVEPRDFHEDLISAAPATPNFEEPKNHREEVCGVISDSNPEKWSYEAVVERSKIRPWRMEKLKMAEQLRENPGDDFLMECWADDPALRIVIKKLVSKFPQWGLVAVDGMLMKWD
jgi:hypothetical protein